MWKLYGELCEELCEKLNEERHENLYEKFCICEVSYDKHVREKKLNKLELHIHLRSEVAQRLVFRCMYI